MAASTLASAAICLMPAAAIAMNQTSVIGPKKVATLAVPRDCTAHPPIRIPPVSGTM